VSERLLRYTQTTRSSFVGCCNDDVDGTSKRRQKKCVENSTVVFSQSKAMVIQPS
jgi:hypothetical protein